MRKIEDKKNEEKKRKQKTKQNFFVFYKYLMQINIFSLYSFFGLKKINILILCYLNDCFLFFPLFDQHSIVDVS